MTLTTFSSNVLETQDEFTTQWHLDSDAQYIGGDPLLKLVAKQHQFNFDLWHEEDKAREPNVSDATIATVKRNIDGLNQNRNDMITKIDEYLEDQHFSGNENSENLPWNSETIGSIVDRLSIASLKTFHMREQTERDDADEAHIANCAQKLERLLEQQNDLCIALRQLVDDVVAGKKQNKLYRQFKMYNDPALNSKIYNKTSD